MLIDTHAHLNSPPFEEDLEEVIKRCQEGNVWVINVGTHYEDSKRAVEIAEKYSEGIFAAIGLHPEHLGDGVAKLKINGEEYIIKREKRFEYEKYKKLGKSPKVVAIGEIGLDYWHKPKTKKKLAEFKQKQKELLLEQIKLAEELNLPIIFHCRLAHNDLIEVLKSEIRNPKSKTNPKSQIPSSKPKGVVHCFTGSWEQAREYMDMGFYLGFNGLIFKLNLDEIIKKTPLERILIETDCPFLTPPQAKSSRNEPIFVRYIAQKIAEIKKEPFKKIMEATTKNAMDLFKID